jgi:hypothetical protein
MIDKRGLRRRRKRFSIRFGLESPNRIAFIQDLSPSGMFISTTNVLPPHSRIQVRLEVTAGEVVDLEAQVIWALKIPQELQSLVSKGGMGVRFLGIRSGQEAFRQYLLASAG